ncbi:carboxymuconolactone decarboxylase family protein [Pseudorhodoferax soli]|uniref:Alkylhydroperoxidase family enzyme n=1 Tax=Pseudorhodoferax soli TaxID=545864 RepID=A0A368XPD2_9BURK|nr:carboxymuconolactone decarboxylase family protein [Pseudorhodoferax soli]RCW69409.1 alkylhydroperoxidase family enzyme [Pseudorhodoferax soli]
MPAHIAPLPAFDSANAPAGLQALVDFVGYRPHALLTMARHDGLLPAVLGLVQATLRGPGPLEEPLRFLVGCEASRVSGCGYSAAHAAHVAIHLGVPLAKLAALDRHAGSPLYTPRERAALALADAAARPRARGASVAHDAAFASVRACFSEEELLALVAVVSAFGWFNRWNSLVRSELEAEPATMVEALRWLGPLLDASP